MYFLTCFPNLLHQVRHHDTRGHVIALRILATRLRVHSQHRPVYSLMCLFVCFHFSPHVSAFTRNASSLCYYCLYYYTCSLYYYCLYSAFTRNANLRVVYFDVFVCLFSFLATHVSARTRNTDLYVTDLYVTDLYVTGLYVNALCLCAESLPP